MGKIGAGGLACSIIGLILTIVASVLGLFSFLLAMLGSLAFILPMIFVYAGIGLAVLGLILGIVGAAKDDKKAPGIVAIVLGGITIVLVLFNPILLVFLLGGIGG